MRKFIALMLVSFCVSSSFAADFQSALRLNSFLTRGFDGPRLQEEKPIDPPEVAVNGMIIKERIYTVCEERKEGWYELYAGNPDSIRGKKFQDRTFQTGKDGKTYIYHYPRTIEAVAHDRSHKIVDREAFGKYWGRKEAMKIGLMAGSLGSILGFGMISSIHILVKYSFWKGFRNSALLGLGLGVVAAATNGFPRYFHAKDSAQYKSDWTDTLSFEKRVKEYHPPQ